MNNKRHPSKVILSIDDALRLVHDVAELLRSEETLQQVQLQQVVVVGDLHGQFFDLLRIFDSTGNWVADVVFLCFFAYPKVGWAARMMDLYGFIGNLG